MSISTNDRKEFLKEIDALANSLREMIEAEVEGFDISDEKRKERINSVMDKETGYKFFLENYFPHIIRDDSRAQVHLWLLDQIPKITLSEDSHNLAVAAPRGDAKTTYLTHIFNLWTIVTGYKHYNVIISDSFEQASMFLELSKAELLYNKRLRSDFPNVVGKGTTWRIGLIITNNNVKVQSLGRGENVRGLRHGAYRPELVFIDDLENDENVKKPDQRDKIEAYLDSAVEGLGEVGSKFDIIFAGTVLHHDSVLMRKLKNAFWSSKIFKAIVEWPANLHLWDEWESLQPNGILDSELKEENRKKALQFYLDHKEEMHEGAILSWSRRDLYKTMERRARIGHSAFDAEAQNDAVDKGATFSDCIHFWTQLPDKANLLYFGATDPAMGKKSSNCPSSNLVGALDVKTGKLYVTVADIRRRVPDKIISDVIEQQKINKTLAWAFESVLFQEFVRTELVRRSAKQGVPVPAVPIHQTQDKILRIEALQPHMANGLILIHPSHKELENQLRHFPNGLVDGPDALQMLWSIALSRSQSYEFTAVSSNYKIDMDDDNYGFSRR